MLTYFPIDIDAIIFNYSIDNLNDLYDIIDSYDEIKHKNNICRIYFKNNICKEFDLKNVGKEFVKLSPKQSHFYIDYILSFDNGFLKSLKIGDKIIHNNDKNYFSTIIYFMKEENKENKENKELLYCMRKKFSWTIDIFMFYYNILHMHNNITDYYVDLKNLKTN